jgi:hypothetical protein
MFAFLDQGFGIGYYRCQELTNGTFLFHTLLNYFSLLVFGALHVFWFDLYKASPLCHSSYKGSDKLRRSPSGFN